MRYHSPETIPILLLPFVFLFFGGLFFFHRYTGLPRGKAFLALLASVLAGGIYTALAIERMRHVDSESRETDAMISVDAAGLCIVFLTAFVLRLWGRWVGEKVTAEERRPGLPGINAWFCASNVFVGTAIVLLAWFGYDLPPLQIAVGIAVLLAVYPLIGMEASVPAPSQTELPEDLSAEREKIVSMLVAGKLTADESAELLQALGSTTRIAKPRVSFTSGQRLMLIGAALVTLGFFLPWIVVNPGKEANRMMQQMQSSFESGFGGAMEIPNGMPVGNLQMKTPTISMSGGEIQRGLGWASLLLAIFAAIIPFLDTPLDASARRAVLLLCLGVGGMIVLYLFTQNIRFIGFGLVFAVGGYALEIVGALRERRALGA